MSDSRPIGPHEIHVCFFFNAQRHQLLHGLATAVELARLPGFDVHVISPSASHVDYARTVVNRLGGAPISFVHARSRLLEAGMRKTGSVVPPKLLSLSLLAPWLNGFDAIALPERTSIALRRLGVSRPRFIHLDHGAGDRAAGFDSRIRRFDFVLMAGDKHRERLLGERLITPGNHAVVGYPKFAAADAIRDRDWYPFEQRRPVVLYNPHFSKIGSWEACGEAVLTAFAAQDRYNLLVAPHVRLLDSHKARKQWGALLDRFDACPNIHIDRGSDRAIDMTHTSLADLYLGDVSSQVYEYLRTPRPCLFLDPHGIDWSCDENYAHWHFGNVLTGSDRLIEAVDRAFECHPTYVQAQTAGVARTFAGDGGADRAAQAIATYLERSIPPVRPSASTLPATAKVSRGLARNAWRISLLVPVLAMGWMLGESIRPAPTIAATPFLDRAIASHRTTLLRLEMHSQPESRLYDRDEIRMATGIIMPVLPADWVVGDMQLYPSTYGHLVQVYLRTPEGEALSLVAMRIDANAGRQPLIEDRRSERIAYWENGDFAFALVGQLPPSRLLRLASYLSSTV